MDRPRKRTLRISPSRLVAHLRSIRRIVFGPIVLCAAYLLPIYRWLTQTIAGAGALMVALYFAVPMFSSTEPYSPTELLEWFATLESPHKWAAGAVLTTILGFMFAFHAASAQARQQIRLQLMATATEDFQAHFDIALRSLVALFIGARQIATQVESFQGQESPKNVHMASWLNQQAIELRRVWDDLMALHVRMITLGSKHGAVFTNRIGLPRNYDFALKTIGDVVDRPYPLPMPQDPQTFSFSGFLEDSRVNELKSFADLAEAAHERVSFVQGMVTTTFRNSIEPVSMVGTLQSIRPSRLGAFARQLGQHYDEMLRSKRGDD